MIKYFCDLCNKEVWERNVRAPGTMEALVTLREMQFMVSIDVRSPVATESDALCDACKILAVQALLKAKEDAGPQTPKIPEGMP